MRSLDLSELDFTTSSATGTQDTLDTQAVLNTDLLMRPVYAARDAEWETELLTQLSEQEQRFREFTRRRFQTEPHMIAELCLRMVQAIDAYTACHAERATLIRAHLPETRATAAPFLELVQNLPRPAAPRTLLGIKLGTPRIEPELRAGCVQVLHGLPRVIESYLLLLGNGFATGQMAAKWVETSGVFIRQLTKLSKHISGE